MDVINLPDDIVTDKKALESSIILHPYSAEVSHFKEKSVLLRNVVSLVVSGQKTIQFAEKSVNTNDREIHFLSASNSIASFDITDNVKFESIIIFFDDQELTAFAVAHAEMIDRMQEKYKLTTARYVSFEKDDFIRHYIDSLQIMVSHRKPLTIDMKRIKLWELLLYLMENRTQRFLSFLYRDRDVKSEREFRRVVEADSSINLTLDEMAFLLNLSVSTFKRRFAKIYNTSPKAWLLERKMKMAAQLLRQRRESPGDIWFRLGFDTYTGFTKSFKKHFGMAPKAYMQNLSRKEQFLDG